MQSWISNYTKIVPEKWMEIREWKNQAFHNSFTKKKKKKRSWALDLGDFNDEARAAVNLVMKWSWSCGARQHNSLRLILFFRLFAKWMYYCNSYSYSKTVSDPSFKEKNKETFYLNHRVPPQLTRTLTPVSEMTVMHEWRMNYFFLKMVLYTYFESTTSMHVSHQGKKKRSDEAIQLASKGKLD